MVSNPTAAPILFDRALLRARIERARRGGPVTFLLDRVAEDMEERLQAVMRSFAAGEPKGGGGVSRRVARFGDLADIGALLQREGLALRVPAVDRVVVRYDSAFSLMADTRRMGATNILRERRRTPPRRATML